TAAPTPSRAVSLGGRRVLVVDDNETNRRILRDMLGAEGVAVHEAARADAGMAALRRAAAAGTPFDLAILDAQMPDQDGFGLRVRLEGDNGVSQQRATAMLEKRGHQVEVVGNGREAADAVGARDYDLVLMDIQMPEMDGFAARAAIRALPRGRTIPIIALTAHALSGERERCLERGMTGYLAKPFKAHDLFAVIEGRTAATTDTVTTPPPPVDLAAFRSTMREAGAEEAVGGMLARSGTPLPS